MMINLCFPKYFEIHNAVPLRLEKSKYFEEIIDTIYATIHENFKGSFRTELVSIEMNITEVFEECDYEKIFLLFSHALLDKVKQNARYEIKSDKSIIIPMTSGIKTRLIKGRYLIKAYDKKKQIEAQQGFSILEHPIRIEFVFSRRAIKKIFGSNPKLNFILTQKGMNILIRTYVETIHEVINDSILPYLDKIHEQLMIHIRETRNIQDTYCKYKEVIYDQEQLRRVLKEWYKERGMSDNSRSTLAKLKKKFDLPKGTISFLSHFIKM